MVQGFIWFIFLIGIPLYCCQSILSQSDEENCITKNGREGICILYDSCDLLRHSVQFDQIKEHQCGIEDDQPKVCCPVIIDYEQRTTEIIMGRSATRARLPNSPPKSPLLPEDCGFRKVAMSKIVGGNKATLGAWPWTAAMYLKIYGNWEACCGGTLISEQHVITAAHCLVDSRGKPIKAKSIKIRLGEHNLIRDDDGADPLDYLVISFTAHPDFILKTYLNDIGILKLDKKVVFSNHILPACLPFGELYNEDLAGKEATVVGWGTVDFKGPPSDILLEAEVTIVTNALCKKAFRREVIITDVYLCAGVDDGSRDACRGDSGGPLIATGSDYRSYLIGVVSFGKFCATPGYPGVYSRVTEFLEWINENLE